MRRAEIVARGLVIATALAATATGAPPLISVPAALLSLLNGGQLIARIVPSEDPVERCLASAGGVAVLLILLGVLLNYAPGGITTSSYAVGWALVSWALLVLASRQHRAAHAGLGGATAPLAMSLAMLAAATAVGYEIGSAAVRKQEQQPVLALSALSYGAHNAQILVSSVNAGGIYELLVLPDGHIRGARGSSVELAQRGAHSTELSVALPPAQCSWKLLLRPRNQPTAERELILWAGTSSAGMQRTGLPPLPLAATRSSFAHADRSCDAAR
jgi:hypothetical protein